MVQDLAAVLAVSGRILAAIKLPIGVVFWDLFAHRCTVIPQWAGDPETFDLVEELKDIPGMRFVLLEDFVSKVAVPFCMKGDVGIFEKKPAPTLAAFGKEFLVWAKAQFREKPKTLSFYRNGINRLSEYQPLASLVLDDKRITERLTGYITKRQTATVLGGKQRKALQVASINRELQVLRRLLNLAVEWGRIESAPKIKMLNGENHREFVLLPAEEEKYLLAAPKLLADVKTVLVDSGLRPEECYRLEWENVSWDNGRFGTFLVTHGKTKAARRVLPMNARVREILEVRWTSAEKPVQGWVWPADTKSEHIEPSTLKKQHRKALKVSKVRPFVLYALRHTFLTRLGQRGCDVWTLARIAGHSSITMSKRYVHPDGRDVLAVLDRDLAQISGGHEFGHSEEMATSDAKRDKQISA